MKKIAVLSIIFLFITLQSFSQSFDPLEKLTIEAADKAGKSVVSISGLFKEKGKAFSFNRRSWEEGKRGERGFLQALHCCNNSRGRLGDLRRAGSGLCLILVS